MITDHSSELMQEAPPCGYPYEDRITGRWVTLLSRWEKLRDPLLTSRYGMLTVQSGNCAARMCRKIGEGHHATYSHGLSLCFDSNGNLKKMDT